MSGKNWSMLERTPLYMNKDGVVLSLTQDFSQDVIFSPNGKDVVLKLCGNGEIFVHGRLVTTDTEIVDGLREVLKQSKIERT